MKKEMQRKAAIDELRNNGMSFENIGRIFRITRQRAHQIYHQIYCAKKSTWDYKTKTIYCRNKHHELRALAVLALGGKCAVCGEDDYRCLQIDHINGGGTKENKKMSSYSKHLWIVEHTDDAKKVLQILCANHNWIKRFENREVPRLEFD